MPTLAEELLEIVARLPGQTDREIAEALRGPGAPQQSINQEARLLAGRNLLTRQKRPDGLIGNYPGKLGDDALVPRGPARKSEPVPPPPDFSHVEELISAVSSYVLLPNAAVVAALGGAVFPSVRDQQHRITVSSVNGRKLLLDDNTTARWAMLWSHGYTTTAHPKGWTFAHVWPLPKDPECYTHVANLAMMPEYLASLSDKDGPLGAYLRYHAWAKYRWKPSGEAEPEEPEGYPAVSWRYLREEADPIGVIDSRVSELQNKRCKLLRSLR